jgi:hypothetical protein
MVGYGTDPLFCWPWSHTSAVAESETKCRGGQLTKATKQTNQYPEKNSVEKDGTHTHRGYTNANSQDSPNRKASKQKNEEVEGSIVGKAAGKHALLKC